MDPEQEQFDKLATAVKELADTVQTAVEQGQENDVLFKTEAEKMGVELVKLQRKVDDFEHVVTEKLDVLDEQHELENAAIFDVHLKNPELFSLWGYDDPVTKALYQPRTRFDPNRGWVKDGTYDGMEDLMRLNDFLYIASVAKAGEKGKDWKNYDKYLDEFETKKLFDWEMKAHPVIGKALSSSVEGAGADFVPTQLSAQIIDDIRLALKVAALFPTVQLTGKGATFEYPVRGARQRAYKVPESTADDSAKIPAGTLPTDKISLTVIKHALRMLYSDEFEEDSLVAALPLITAEITQALADGKEDAIINGDLTDTHMDSDVTSSYDVRKSWDGLRDASGGAAGNAAIDISTWDNTTFLPMRKAMGRFGIYPTDLALIMSINGFIDTLKITNVMTVDKYGQFATILSGELGKYFGVPIIVSEFVRNDLTTAGIYDGATVTDTIMLLVNRRAFWFGERGQIRQETDRDIETQQNKVVMSHRTAFKEVIVHGTGEESVGFGYSRTA